MGEFDWRDGNIYVGMFHEGKQEGYGHYKWPTGGSYEGEWKDDRMSGMGVYRRNDGVLYVGSWLDDHQFGEGLRVHGERIASGKDKRMERKRVIRERWNEEKKCIYSKEVDLHPDMLAVLRDKQKFMDTDIWCYDQLPPGFQPSFSADTREFAKDQEHQTQINPEPVVFGTPVATHSSVLILQRQQQQSQQSQQQQQVAVNDNAMPNHQCFRLFESAKEMLWPLGADLVHKLDFALLASNSNKHSRHSSSSSSSASSSSSSAIRAIVSNIPHATPSNLLTRRQSSSFSSRTHLFIQHDSGENDEFDDDDNDDNDMVMVDDTRDSARNNVVGHRRIIKRRSPSRNN